MKNNGDQSKARQEQAVFSLPPALLREAKRFAKEYHNGNNSGFVAAAIRAYIDHLRKVRHTAKLRASYAAAAKGKTLPPIGTEFLKKPGPCSIPHREGAHNWQASQHFRAVAPVPCCA